MPIHDTRETKPVNLLRLFYKALGGAGQMEQPAKKGLQRMNSVNSKLIEADLKKVKCIGS
jgi:hypothetical protein